ncbi:hypothetical protein TPY_0948 [Sulfobacillus acidophilus TPY]|uniref:tRNA threonylcarbamoyladenosine biosynthesis protein TsaE n=1 Tax=Sulfobacillus acidophilus (strain ATCC 700253 / DSM 10332 / NAL) TaxID=679936 RepID=G8TXV3_SULAD|nr:hypothetical protein TPY_0948 [Sulfobacillus acidophilus TPY]AEW06159.1 Uncharacterized protein family UPF0079, ATPase [Sulfobacillus acidophilus DSM 10332]
MADAPSTTLTVEWTARDLADTERIAARLAEILREGGVLLLKGDLGAGKTTLAQSLLRNLGVMEPVKSPTFDLVHAYRIPGLDIVHADLYRIEQATDVWALDLPAFHTPGTVLVVEWGEAIQDQYPERVECTIDVRPDGTRQFIVQAWGRPFVEALRRQNRQEER